MLFCASLLAFVEISLFISDVASNPADFSVWPGISTYSEAPDPLNVGMGVFMALTPTVAPPKTGFQTPGQIPQHLHSDDSSV